MVPVAPVHFSEVAAPPLVLAAGPSVLFPQEVPIASRDSAIAITSQTLVCLFIDQSLQTKITFVVTVARLRPQSLIRLVFVFPNYADYFTNMCIFVDKSPTNSAPPPPPAGLTPQLDARARARDCACASPARGFASPVRAYQRSAPVP